MIDIAIDRNMYWTLRNLGAVAVVCGIEMGGPACSPREYPLLRFTFNNMVLTYADIFALTGYLQPYQLVREWATQAYVFRGNARFVDKDTNTVDAARYAEIEVLSTGAES